MRIRFSVIAVIAVLFIIMCQRASAQGGPDGAYTTGYSSGLYDRSFGLDSSQLYWDNYLLYGRTEYDWYYYFGYYQAVNGLAENAESVPTWEFAPASATSEESILTRQLIVNQGTNRLAINYRKIVRRIPEVGAAGPLNNLATTLDFSYSTVEDTSDHLGGQLAGDYKDTSGGILMSGMLGDNLLMALGYTRSTYRSKDVPWDQSTDNIDAYFTYGFSEAINVGAFLSFSSTDIEDRHIGPATVKGDSFDRWGGGLLASADVPLCQYANLGIVGTLASMNKSSVGALGDDEDSAGIVLVDVTTFPNDNVTASLYGSYFALLDREFGPDGSYFIFGAECGWKVSANSTLSLGYEINAADNDRDEERLNLSLSVTF